MLTSVQILSVIISLIAWALIMVSCFKKRSRAFKIVILISCVAATLLNAYIGNIFSAIVWSIIVTLWLFDLVTDD